MIGGGLIITAVKHSKINKSMNNACNMKDNMENILDDLENQLKVKSQQQHENEKEKTFWLEKYKE